VSGNGGKRPGAGRKPGSRNHAAKIADDVARRVLSEVDQIALWKKFLHCRSIKVAAGCLQYLTDRAFGRPAQTIQGGTQPLKIEFSWNGTPEWMSPLQPRMQSKNHSEFQSESNILAKALIEQVAERIDEGELQLESEE